MFASALSFLFTMANEKTTIDEWAVKDLEDGSSLRITVLGCTELGNQSLPGIQVLYMGNTINYEPLITERWAYQASKKGVREYLLEDYSWMVHDDQFVKNYLVLDSPLKVKVEVKTRSSKIIAKEYELPFEV
ncbi:hypothetical protein GCM10027341_23640 [Spirosoma knui]